MTPNDFCNFAHLLNLVSVEIQALIMYNYLKNLENIRSSLRTNAMASSLFDVDDFTESFSATLKKIWAENINK